MRKLPIALLLWFCAVAVATAQSFMVPGNPPAKSNLPQCVYPLTKTLFAYTGANQTYAVGSGLRGAPVTCIRYKAWGGAGGDSGAAGGYVAVFGIPVVSGETLNVKVGGGGVRATNGGGSQGGGAGWTSLDRGGTYLAGAGGGGGGANSGSAGAAGCLVGSDGLTNVSGAGTGGTQSAGGSSSGGGSGSSGTGGSVVTPTSTAAGGYNGGGTGGTNLMYASGGGGAGYFGGGSGGGPGGQTSGGGGGSSYIGAIARLSRFSITDCATGQSLTAPRQGDQDYPGSVANGVTTATGQNGYAVIY